MGQEATTRTLEYRIKQLEQSGAMETGQFTRLQNILDTFPFGIYIVNHRFEIEYTNSHLRKQFGEPGELKCYQYFHNLQEPCPWCKNEKVFQGESVVWFWHSEKTNRDYELFDLPLKNGDNSISKLEIFHDITDLKQMAQKQERALGLLEKVYASLNEAVFVVETEQRKIISCNRAAEKMFGYRTDEMVGKQTRMLHVNKMAFQDFGSRLSRALASGREFHVQFSMKNRDGLIFPANHTVKAVRDGSGLPPIHVSVIKDLTFRKLAQEKLAHQQQELKTRAQRLEELNAALKVLLDQREREKKEREVQLSEKIRGLIIPTLNQMRQTPLTDTQRKQLDTLEVIVSQMIGPDDHHHLKEIRQLSPTETTIAGEIKQGYRTKEIAAKMNLSARTVEFHRDNIRKKLNLKGRKVNLKTYLSGLK